eukprot:TRINITY_DN621_c2_g1_i2.p1 TRINITY_DN621_c2_g1~~TRINITY_DN621_c2_g1_i2.p1  ORF type:complete len:224 (+),score=-17.38 TRINITY_DN621_c2_g1_i2:154-825(+)
MKVTHQKQLYKSTASMQIRQNFNNKLLAYKQIQKLQIKIPKISYNKNRYGNNVTQFLTILQYKFLINIIQNLTYITVFFLHHYLPYNQTTICKTNIFNQHKMEVNLMKQYSHNTYNFQVTYNIQKPEKLPIGSFKKLLPFTACHVISIQTVQMEGTFFQPTHSQQIQTHFGNLMKIQQLQKCAKKPHNKTPQTRYNYKLLQNLFVKKKLVLQQFPQTLNFLQQ